MSISVTSFIALTLAEIRVARGGDVIKAADQDLALSLLNELLDSLATTPRALYNNRFDTFTLTAGLQPHTFGPGGNFDTTTRPRPVTIKHASIILPSGSVRVKADIQSEAWWADVRNRLVTSSVPNNLYYDAGWPLGSVNLWPIPSQPYQIELLTQQELASVAATDTLDLPQGYQRWLRLKTAKLCAPAFGQTFSPESHTELMAMESALFGTNDVIPNIRTRDGGMPGMSSMRTGYNFRSGMIE